MSIWIMLGIGVFSIVLIAVLLQLPPQHRFIDCCGNADPTKMIQKIEAGADPNGAGLFGLTPLGEAIRAKHIENVRILLKAGAVVQLPGSRSTHLHTAVEEDAVDIAELLIESGADPNAKNVGGNSPFHLACLNLNLSMAKMMLNHGADVELPVGTEGQQQESLIAMVTAKCSRRNQADEVERIKEMLTLLFDHGSSPNTRSAHGAPLIGLALPEPEVLRLIVDRGAIIDVAWDGLELKDAIEEILGSKATANGSA